METYTNQDVIKLLGGKIEESHIEGDSLLIPGYQLSIKAELVKCQEINGSFMTHVVYFAEHPLFDQTLVESCAGVGDSAEAAIENAGENFRLSVMLPLLAALECDSDEFITADIEGEKHIFRVPCASGTVAMGEQFLEKGDLWTLMEDVIPMYIGCKRVYWVKLFAAMTGDSITCEARINGIVYSGLTELMKQRLPLNGTKVKYGTYKAFIVLIQNEETFTPCPYTRERVSELTASALAKLSKVNDKESHARAIQDIISSAPVESLGWEMAGLIPELYCMIALRLNENDSLMYFKRDSRESGTVRTSQLSSYDPVARGVYAFITQKHPTEDEHLSLLGASSLFKSVHKAILDGAKLEDLRCSDIMYTVGEDYRIY